MRLPTTTIFFTLLACFVFISLAQVSLASQPSSSTTINTGDYVFVNSGVKVPISSGEIFYPIQVSPTEIVRCKNADCTSDERIYKTSDGYGIRGENYWLGVDGQTFRYENADGTPATWMPNTMAVGQQYTNTFTLKSYTIDGNTLIPKQNLGQQSTTVQLLSVGAKTFSGTTYSDVAVFKVTAGPGAGEEFYYAKGVGWIGFTAPGVNNLPTGQPTGLAGTTPTQLAPQTSATTNSTVANNSTNAEINIDLHQYIKDTNPTTLNRFDYAHPIDGNAPQLTSLLSGTTMPAITGAYNVSEIPGVDSPDSWANHINPAFHTAVGLQTTTGQAIQVPWAGYDIGNGYNAMILNATGNSITLKYTRENDIVNGYTLYISNIDVDPVLLKMVQDGVAKGNLVAVDAFQKLGVAKGNEIIVAMRDTGAFMDLMWQEWWNKIIDPTTPLPPSLISFLFSQLPSPTPVPEGPKCESAKAEEGPFRPDPCDGVCNQTPVEPVSACAQSFKVGQSTYVHIPDIYDCPDGSTDGSYAFTRNWGGQVQVDISDTKVPYAGYHETQGDMETKYLSQYLTGTYNRDAPDCDIKDPQCVQKIFKEAGVMSKILPKDIQDQLKCDMITKVGKGQEFDYEVSDGTKKLRVSDFANRPSNNILTLTEMRSAACAEPHPVGVDPSSGLYQEYLREHAMWQEMVTKQWTGSIYEKLWAFIPQVTYKDAPGSLTLTSQGPPGVISPARFGLAFPHLGTLFKSSQILQQALTPIYQESELSSEKNSPVLLADASTAKQLQTQLDDYQSYCGYKQVLGEKTTLLAQNTGQIYRITVENVHLDSNNKIQYGVRIVGLTDQASKNSHIMLGTNGVQPFDLGGAGFPGYYSSDDQNIAAHFGPVAIDANGNFNITVTVNNHTIQVSDNQRMVSGNCTGNVNLSTGAISANCSTGPAPTPKPKKVCGNQSDVAPGSCSDPNAKEDFNPNDLICSAPYPISGSLTVNDFKVSISKSTYDSWVEHQNKCKEKCDITDRGCLEACDWVRYDRLERTVGVNVQIPYLEKIGNSLISNFYRYTGNSGSPGEYTENSPDASQVVKGLFDIFRPAAMKHYPPYEAKSDMGYKYTSGWSDSDPEYFSEPDLISSTQKATPDKADLYYPWLGGVQWAKKCVSEGMLLPADMATSQYCPGIKAPTASSTNNQPTTCTKLDYYIDPAKTSTKNLLDQHKQETLDFVNKSWPANHLEENWDLLVNRAAFKGFNPALLMALYIEESGAGGTGANDAFGCQPSKPKTFSQSLDCFFNDSVAYTQYGKDFEKFMLSYSSLAELNKGCFDNTNPYFASGIKSIYKQITGTDL